MNKLKLVKYGHDYCGPCKMLSPVLKEISTELSDTLVYEEKNTYNEKPEDLHELGIHAVPTTILYKDDQEVWRHVGVISKATLMQTVESFNK